MLPFCLIVEEQPGDIVKTGKTNYGEGTAVSDMQKGENEERSTVYAGISAKMDRLNEKRWQA